jgi:hypothetical protein
MLAADADAVHTICVMMMHITWDLLLGMAAAPAQTAEDEDDLDATIDRLLAERELKRKASSSCPQAAAKVMKSLSASGAPGVPTLDVIQPSVMTAPTSGSRPAQTTVMTTEMTPPTAQGPPTGVVAPTTPATATATKSADTIARQDGDLVRSQQAENSLWSGGVDVRLALLTRDRASLGVMVAASSCGCVAWLLQ